MGKTYMGVPREKIDWYPTIDSDICTGCGECKDFCANDVFELDKAEGIMNVRAQLNCVVGCDKCAQFCPVDALSFPSKEDLRKMMAELRDN